MPTPLRKLLKFLLAALLLPLLLFEEWGWEPLAALAARCARHPVWARLEAWLAALPPYRALLVFLVPVVALLPVKALALYLFSEGHAGSGLAVLVGAKLAGTAVVARLFQLVLPALMGIPLFARWYPPWKAWKDGVLAVVRHSAAWRGVRRFNAGLRRGGRLLRRRWRLAMG